MSARRVALIAHGAGYVGPPLARRLAGDGHDLVLGDPAPGLVEECEALGAAVVAHARAELGPDDRPDHARTLVTSALDRFDRLDAAVTFTGAILGGWFLKDASTEQLEALTRGLINAPFEFLHAVVPAMAERGGGQVLVLTSATAARPTPRAPLYSALRAGADHLVRNVAAEVAPHGVQVNAVGTNYMDFPQYWAAVGGETPERRAKVEAQVPMGRMGGLDELAAFCAVFLDGRSGFATGQTVQFDGGWSV
jgi:NAD(P)-dependent dehydrogenase (short-subunit alcohol dehydrogenase family)